MDIFDEVKIKVSAVNLFFWKMDRSCVCVLCLHSAFCVMLGTKRC